MNSMNAKEIDALIKKYQETANEATETLGSYLDREIKRLDFIKKQYLETIQDERNLKKYYEESKKEIEARYKEIQKNCPHLIQHYNGDPSGNNDSYYECETCRKII